jgi:hypothetical protein
MLKEHTGASLIGWGESTAQDRRLAAECAALRAEVLAEVAERELSLTRWVACMLLLVSVVPMMLVIAR